MKTALTTFLATVLAAASADAATTTVVAGCANAAAYSAMHAGISFLVTVNGKVVCEDYPNGGLASTAHVLASGTKSFSGIMAAAAAQDGLMSLDEDVADTISEWKTDPRKSRITIRQLIGLVSGVPGGPVGAPPPYSASVATAANADPGTLFQYGPIPFEVFGEIMKRKLKARGEPADPLIYLRRRILTPIGIDPGEWRRTSEGDPTMPSEASLTAGQWATFGEFVRLGGKWGGKQLVDPITLAALFKGTPTNPRYGVSFWLFAASPNAAQIRQPADARDADADIAALPRGIVFAAGAGQLRMYVVPTANMVIVRQADRQPRGGGRAGRHRARPTYPLPGRSMSPTAAAGISVKNGRMRRSSNSSSTSNDRG